MSNEPMSPSPSQEYCFISKSPSYGPLRPSLRDNLIKMYELNDIATALARTKPDGSKGVKLRKSYKSHISDLSGRHSIPTPNAVGNFTAEEQAHADRTLSMLASVPMAAQADFLSAHPKIEEFGKDMLSRTMNFEVTGPNGVPGFDSLRLAIDDSANDSIKSKIKRDKKRKAEDELDGKELKRKFI